jgi:CRISPR-associated protein Csx17
MPEILLPGCTPVPMMAYLKALGVLRLLAEQKDSAARGHWRDDQFHLTTALDVAALTHFFLEEYQPTPIVTPWNGGSGFYAGDNTAGREAIRHMTSPRFREYRETIRREVGERIGRDRSPKGVPGET